MTQLAEVTPKLVVLPPAESWGQKEEIWEFILKHYLVCKLLLTMLIYWFHIFVQPEKSLWVEQDFRQSYYRTEQHLHRLVFLHPIMVHTVLLIEKINCGKAKFQSRKKRVTPLISRRLQHRNGTIKHQLDYWTHSDWRGKVNLYQLGFQSGSWWKNTHTHTQTEKNKNDTQLICWCNFISVSYNVSKSVINKPKTSHWVKKNALSFFCNMKNKKCFMKMFVLVILDLKSANIVNTET